MVVPKINSSHGSETRNIINAAIDAINVQGKTVQDLVAEGQLTPAQYTELIQTVNGLIAKGEVSVHDIDVNKGKLLPKHLSEEVLSMIAGDAPINAVPADGSLNTRKYADKSITPRKTSFMTNTDNLFDGEYHGLQISYYSSPRVMRYIKSTNQKTAVTPLEPNQTYTVKIHDPELNEAFRVAISNNEINFDNDSSLIDLDKTILTNSQTIKELTFTNTSEGRYLLVNLGAIGSEPRLQIEKGNEATEYIEPYVMPKDLFFSEIENDFLKFDNTVTIFEDRLKGYPERPNATSVIWIGVNEPHDPESFDEWRETNGYTYFTDFQEYKSHNQMVDWSTPFLNDYTADILVGINNNLLRFNPNINGRLVLAWDNISDDPKRDSIEVFSEVKVDRITQSLTAGVFFNGSGNSVESITGYGAGILSNSDNETELWLARYLNGSASTLASFPFSIDLTKNIKMLVRAESSQIKLKLWQDGYEPNHWQFEVRDDDFLTGEITGLLNTGRNTSMSVSKFGVATGGMKAPKRRLRL